MQTPSLANKTRIITPSDFYQQNKGLGGGGGTSSTWISPTLSPRLRMGWKTTNFTMLPASPNRLTKTRIPFLCSKSLKRIYISFSGRLLGSRIRKETTRHMRRSRASPKQNTRNPHILRRKGLETTCAGEASNLERRGVRHGFHHGSITMGSHRHGDTILGGYLRSGTP